MGRETLAIVMPSTPIFNPLTHGFECAARECEGREHRGMMIRIHSSTDTTRRPLPAARSRISSLSPVVPSGVVVADILQPFHPTHLERRFLLVRDEGGKVRTLVEGDPVPNLVSSRSSLIRPGPISSVSKSGRRWCL